MKFMSGYRAAARPNIGASAKFLRESWEKQTLMYANVAHAELARPFDERHAGLSSSKPNALRTPLRVALPGRDGVTVDRILHELERGHVWASIGHHHGV